MLGPPEWGLAEPGAAGTATVTLPLAQQTGDRTGWLGALAVTLGRYSGQDSVVLGTDHGSVRLDLTGTLGELRPVPTDRPAIAGLSFGAGGARFPLTVFVRADHLLVDYRRSHFAPEIVEQFTRHLAHVHRQAPDSPVATIDVLDAAGRSRVAALGRSPEPLVTSPRCLHEAFEGVAARTPDAIAVSDGGITFTYRMLDVLAASVADGLRAAGVRPGDRVGLCLDRSADFVVAVLGVLKAGATYVPVDPAHPAERLARVLEGADVRLVISGRTDIAPLALTVDELLTARPRAAGRRSSPGDPAYIIHTSGSTGRPKGVVVPHANVIALVDATRELFGLGPHDVWSFFHSGAFDVSVYEMWGCLLTGGRLQVVRHDVSRDPALFRDLLVAERVTVLSQTPSAFVQLLGADHGRIAARLVLFAGEPLDTRVLVPWFDRHPECRVVNLYGITETTVHASHLTVTRELAEAATRCVGTALPGWHFYVLDEAGRLVPPGVVGEIHVGGAGVATGYLGQEELTSQRFLPDPYTGGTMYRSGDLGRLRPDGTLDHLGRADHQVKIRGFRIELGEIRAAMLEEPRVRAAAAVVRRGDPADPATARIDAYVVSADGTADGVRDRVALLLPDYMVPATVTPVAELPLTPNGKLDVARLPEPRFGSAPVTDGENDLVSRLRRIWSAVLGVAVGADDDFFELGGNSMSAVRISTAMTAAGMPPIVLANLYRTPTVREVAAGLESAG
ncbi:non-ribosomal peptide synthetase [Amycolatopsis sp.]|uniref:non-ribosomal peptide synthetase n=1 Tax=Amycolatopsis sp. TaxID=37632 RepID=UPI002D7F45CB|nr:non-ribosomal peptide synthetase [Amycolatopsis sp.]HET6711445.1 non-ribosomal peptide synthetase [Amycolatopsis sp.]